MALILVVMSLTSCLFGQSFEHGEIGINGFGAVERRGDVNQAVMGVGVSYQAQRHIVPFVEVGTAASERRRLLSYPVNHWSSLAGIRIPLISTARVEPYVGIGAGLEAGRCTDTVTCRPYEPVAAALAGARLYLTQGFGLQPEIRLTRLLRENTLVWRVAVNAFFSFGEPHATATTSRRRRALIAIAILGTGGAAIAVGSIRSRPSLGGSSAAGIALGGSVFGPPK